MKDWSKVSTLNIGHGSYVYDSELESINYFSGKKLVLFRNSLPGTDLKSLLMIQSKKGNTSIELGNKELKTLFLKFCKELEAEG